MLPSSLQGLAIRWLAYLPEWDSNPFDYTTLPGRTSIVSPEFPPRIPRKTESKKILKLEEKVKAQREIKELERKRNEMRMNLYQAQDEVEDKKEKLLDDVEARLQQNIKKEELFFTKWKVI